MSPENESTEARLAAAETTIRDHGRQLRDHNQRLNGFGLVSDKVIELTSLFKSIIEDVAEIKQDNKQDKKDRADGDLEARRINTQIKIALWGILGAVVCATIGAITLIATSGGFH